MTQAWGLGVLAVAGLCLARPAVAQTAGPVSGHVLDVRIATATLPTDPTFYPALANDTLIPGRSWGGEVGGAVYPWQWGPARIGVGGSVLRTRGTSSLAGADAIVANVTAVSSQVSFNFGTRLGWSYLGGGLGSGTISTEVTDVNAKVGTAKTGQQLALNVGGGARWFTRSRLALSLDARLHRLGGGSTTPGASLLVVSAGLSLR